MNYVNCYELSIGLELINLKLNINFKWINNLYLFWANILAAILEIYVSKLLPLRGIDFLTLKW